MNRLKKRIRQAQRRGVYFLARGNCPMDFYPTHRDKFDIYVESEGMLGPRELALTKRQAIATAYRISVSKKPKVTITVS